MLKLLLLIPVILILVASLYVSRTSVVIQKTSPPGPALTPEFVPPVSDYKKRITRRAFGQLVSSADQKKVICGAPFTGYHTGADFEILPGEENSSVPVYSVSAGKIIFIDWVSGYGGLLITQNLLNNRDVTILYGHIDLNSVTGKVGDTVSAGEHLADLGAACSHATDGERKHLHLAIHKGTEIDYRGYVSAVAGLSAWLDPQLIFK